MGQEGKGQGKKDYVGKLYEELQKAEKAWSFRTLAAYSSLSSIPSVDQTPPGRKPLPPCSLLTQC